MNIAELIDSTGHVEGYGSKNTFKNKTFGAIFMYNKVVRTKPGSSIIEVSMMIKGTSDRILAAKESAGRSVAVHKVMVAIHGVEQKVVNGKDLAGLIRLEHPEFKDEEAYPDRDLIQLALESKPLAGKTVLSQSANDYIRGTYVIITDKIKKESQIRVWCSCSSYYWTFQFYNVENNVDIWGKYPDRYIPKTKKSVYTTICMSLSHV